ncbi:succinate dehydrogenase hydrophobic membrane anchor protein [Actinomadura sp. KC345]|uniref:succinate dehydrogenase hydrophobic membrane anchor protein n=1 Tax=Actinomadura sp. KC345 TaxID=2530371 RepID=UPI0010447FF1|nr:succinate dehydrogenase hydrophobic membrane anchor protein [Actinomadura sp. KC345]TDC51682.1 succinate dehydrogenase hydrophobic membrane anchor protein [Actinomadura sp. KC345]
MTTETRRPRMRPGGIGIRSFLVIRTTGVLLAVLALGHFGLTHIVHDVAETDSSFIARRWSSALWVVWDGLLLVSALAHVGAAMTAVVRDYQTDRAGQRRTLTWLRALLAALLVVGALTLIVSAG